jgi:signal transduction histidine kinase
VLGLVGAVHEQSQLHPDLVIRVDAPETLPPLPTAIETTAYLIVLEALTNVEKHAAATACTIRMRFVNGSSMLPSALLELDIIDDGRGLPRNTSTGLGLLTMQARAAEVGGTCRIESTPLGGTHVGVRLPCPLHVD